MVIKSQLATYARCKLLIIANENNYPFVVGGILGLSSIIISSPESISMISEAVCAEKYVVVFKSGKLSVKHQRFLKNYQDKKYIYLEEIKDLSARVNQLSTELPQVSFPRDNLKVLEGLNKIL
jgi:mitochondrial fission protein ELM1